MSEDYLCHGTTRSGDRCARLGHRLVDGERRCSVHSGDDFQKATIMCVGFDAAGLPCRNAANVLAGERPVCGWHSQVFAQHGTLTAPRKAKRKKQVVEEVEASANGDGVTDLDLGIPGGLDAAMGTLRQRLAGVGQGMFTEIEAVFRDGLKAKKATQATCPNCAHRFRVYVADLGVRLATSKLILERLISPTQGGASADLDELYAFDPTVALHEMSNAQLLASVHPPLTWEEWDEAHSRHNNLGAKAEWVAEVARRQREGKRVSDAEIEEAREALSEIVGLRVKAKQYLEITAAADRVLIRAA